MPAFDELAATAEDAVMADDEKLSRKEAAKKLRKEAYQRVKEQRAKDPRFIAMKEAAKAHRREMYRKAKEQRKAVAAEEKVRRAERHAAELHDKDLELMKLVWSATKGPYSEN